MSAPAVQDESSRLALAIDSQIAAIARRATKQAGVYLRLAEILPQGIGAEISEWREEQRALQGSDPAVQSGNLAGIIRGLENQLMHLGDALSWSLSSSGVTWWLNQRSKEIGIAEYLVIPRGSYSSDFQIDTIGELRGAVDNLVFVGAAQLDADTLDGLAKVRLLNVPLYDGLEAKWYPILTHELAHLKFEKGWISEWVAGLDTQPNSAARIAADYAVARRNDPQRSPWFDRLLAWLTEVACDSAMCFYYRAEGANALESISRLWGNQDDSTTHPAPSTRLLIQRSSDLDCLDRYRTSDYTSVDLQTSRNAFCDLALRLREDVKQELGTRFPHGARAIQNTVFRQAVKAIEPDIDAALSPSTQTWDRTIVKDSPSVVESGLVRALWSGEIQEAHGSYAAYDDRADLITRSMETLEFIHRFEEFRAQITDEEGSSPYNEPIVNNLWITADGIRTEDPTESSDTPIVHIGQPAYDLRLGRYFIAFNRNEIATLNATNMVNSAERVQRLVEVAWDDAFVLHPGEMVLGVTMECLIVSTTCTAQVLSRSSVGRLGLLTATAVHIQPGYRGCPTLELVNLSSVPLSLVPGQRIAQVVPHQICGESDGYYGYYQNIGWKPQFSKAERDGDTRILSLMRKGKPR
jgi:deoxycytidine triphosphate deaminase